MYIAASQEQIAVTILGTTHCFGLHLVVKQVVEGELIYVKNCADLGYYAVISCKTLPLLAL
jgi:hypothetical protein